jgi:hypothetical protein
MLDYPPMVTPRVRETICANAHREYPFRTPQLCLTSPLVGAAMRRGPPALLAVDLFGIRDRGCSLSIMTLSFSEARSARRRHRTAYRRSKLHHLPRHTTAHPTSVCSRLGTWGRSFQLCARQWNPGRIEWRELCSTSNIVPGCMSCVRGRV